MVLNWNITNRSLKYAVFSIIKNKYCQSQLMTPLDVMKIIVKIMMQKSKYVFLHVHPICSKSAVLIRLADFKLFKIFFYIRYILVIYQTYKIIIKKIRMVIQLRSQQTISETSNIFFFPHSYNSLYIMKNLKLNNAVVFRETTVYGSWYITLIINLIQLMINYFPMWSTIDIYKE